MSISGTLTTALSGLTAASRSAEVVSNNISNALTEGYGRREIHLSSRVLGGFGTGVRVDGVVRHSDPLIIGNRRLAEATLGQVGVESGFLNQIESAIGTPDQPGSLTARLADLESRLIEAASRPDSASRQEAAVFAARDVAGTLNSLSDRVQTERTNADAAIAEAVGTLNATLQQIATLNGQIVRYNGASQDSGALVDQRQQLIDSIADLIPLREVPRENGSVALFTTGGATLLDLKAADIEFSQAGGVTAHTTLAGGGLSGLTINGQPVSTDPNSGPIAGGKLAGLFDLRDRMGPEMQTRLDGFARDLIERFEDPVLDATLVAGDPGLFTDAGNALNVADELGLSARIAVNAAVDPSQGGEVWRLRDGLGAAAPGDPGNAALLGALNDALTTNRVPATGGFSGVPRSSGGLAADLLSSVSVAAARADATVAFNQAQTDTLTALELQGGVDTDAEMQRLLLIEQAFAANARVVATVDELIQTLLGL